MIEKQGDIRSNGAGKVNSRVLTLHTNYAPARPVELSRVCSRYAASLLCCEDVSQRVFVWRVSRTVR